jgi:hypothetical protein
MAVTLGSGACQCWSSYNGGDLIVCPCRFAGWPESDDSQYLWREGGAPAREAYANVAKAISQFEPLFMMANPGIPAENAKKVAGAHPAQDTVHHACTWHCFMRRPLKCRGALQSVVWQQRLSLNWQASAQVFADAPNVHVIECPINDGWTRDVSDSASATCLHAHLPSFYCSCTYCRQF